MSVSKSALATLEDPVALGAIQASNGSFADTPERRVFENAREEAAVNAVNTASGFKNALTRALQPDDVSVLDALDAQKMIEPSTRVRSGLRAARTMAYARDILKNPDRYQDGDASAALDALSDGFSHDVSEWKRVKGMTDDPRQNLSTYVNMLDGLAIPANLADAEPSSPYAAYYEATRSQETRDWDAIASAPLDVRFSHALAKDPGGWRLTDAAKDWVHAKLFDEDGITPEEEAAWVASEGGYDADAMRRYFANFYARGKSAKEIVRDRERQLALEGAAGVLVHSKPDDGRIPDQDYLVNPRQGNDGKLEYDRIEKLTDLTLEEYAETEKRRDDFVMKRRVVDAYQKRMDKKVAEDRAHAMLPFLNEYEAAAALSALRGEDMAKYRSFFENGFGDDAERRDMVWSVCASLRPRDAHGAWEDLIGRFGEGVDKAAFLSGKAASSLWNSYTRWAEIIGTLAASGQEAAIAEKKASDEELKEFSKDLRFQLQYRQTMEAWIPNADDNFAEQAVKGLADSGFLQGVAITASLAHIGGSVLMRAPHPVSKVGGVVLHVVGYLTDAFGAALMFGNSFENMMMNGVDAERAATVGLYAGCLTYLIEKGDVYMFLGKGLSPAELRKTGFRALFKAIAKKDPRLVMETLKADAKIAGRVARAECAEEFGQELVDSGALKFAKGGELSVAAFANAYLNQDTLKDGIDAFIDAIPTCTGFGLMANHSLLRGKNAQAVDAYAQLADETAKRYALKYHIDTSNAEDMAKVRRLVLENAVRHARTAANMDYEQRRAYFGQAAQEAGMSPSEAAFYEQAADLYRTLSSFEGQQYADAAMHGEINEAVLARAGIAVGHDENGYINAVTVDGHTRTVVTERGTRAETDAHTGETGNVRGYYDPKDDSIHITVPDTVSDVGETARTTTAPHELLHAALEAMANDPALTEEQRQTLDALLKTETPSPNGTKLDANEAAAQFVERVFAVANRNFTPDREVVAIGNVVRNIGIALKKALGSKSEYLPAIIRKAGKGGISITDLLDPSFLADLDALQIAAEDKGTADPVVAWYANTMQPFFKALVDARSRTETTANLDAAEAQTAAERGDTRGNSAAAGITLEDTTSSTGDIEPVADIDTKSQSSQQSQSSQITRSTINLPNGYSAEYEVEEMPLSYVVMPGDPDYDQNLANLYALQEAEPEDGVPVVVGGGNLLCGVNAIRRALDEGKTRITVRRIRRLRKDKQPSGQISASQEAKRTGVRRFLEVHGNAYPALYYWLEHGRRIIDGSDPYIKAYLDNLSPADRMFLTGFGKGGTTADHLVEDFLNQYSIGNETANERHYDGTMKPEDVLDQALRERDAYRQWKADGALSPDEQKARDEHDKFIADGHTEDEWKQHLEDMGNQLLGDEAAAAKDAEAAATIDAQIAADVAAGIFSLVREYDDIIGDQLAAMTDAPRYSLPQTASWTVYAEPNDVRSMSPEHLVHEDPLTDKTDNTSVVKAMRVLFTSIGAVRNGNDGSYAVFNNRDAGKMLMQSGADMRIFAPHMKRLFEGAVLSWSEPPLDMNGHTPHPDVIGYKQYINKFTDADGIEKFVRFTVREHKGKDGRRGIHAATISEVSVYQEESAVATNPANKSGGSNRNFTDVKIAKFLSKGKGASSVNAPRFSLSLGIEGEGDPFAAKNNPVDFLLAHRIFANGGKVPSRKETDKLLKRFGSKEQPRDVIARAVSLSQNIAGFLDRIGQDPDVVRAVAAAGLAVEAKGAQARAQNALMTFDAKAAEAKGKIDAAYRRQVENASGIGYREMLSYYGLDMEQILLAMPPPSQNRTKTAQDAAGDAPTPDAYELTDADRAAVDAAVAAIVSRGEGLAAAANAEHPGQPEKATEHETTDTVDEAEADPEFLRAQAMNAAVVEAVRKSGITIDNPLAMVALVRRLTEDYIRRNPDTVPDFNAADPFASRVALAVFSANLSQFAQAVAQGYAPSYARVRIARLCERLDGRGLITLRQVERVGEMIFADLSRDVIRQSRADLMRKLHNGDAPKKGEAKDPNRWRGIDYYAKKHGVNLSEPDRVVSAFAGNYLRILKRVVELSQAKAAERAAKLQETVDAFKDTDDKAKYRDYQNALLELDILAAYGALRTKMPAEIADKSAVIKAFVMQDLDALNAKKEAFEQKRVTLRDAMTSAIAGNPKDNGRMPDKHPGFLYSLVGMLEARASVLTSFCKDPAKRQAALDAFAYVQRLLFHGYTQERAFLNDAKVAMRDAVKSVFGRFGQNTFAKLLDTKLDEATCKLLDRGGQKTKWRIGNVMQMYVSCLQADYAENCKTHGRDGDYVNVLKSVIEKADPRLLRMIDVMRGMYAGYGREISKATLSASGVPIQTPNPLYMPVKPLLLMRAKNGEGRAFHPYAPSLTPRVKHGYDFDQSADIMELWQDRINQSAHTIGFLEAAPLIQGTMQSSHVLEAIHAAWGEKYANHWNDYVLTCMAGRKATSMPKVMANLSRAASRLFLWFNVGSNINQLQAVFTSALSRDVGGMRGMAKHLSFWALKPVEMWQAARDLTETMAFKARYGSDLNAAIAAAQREGKYGVLRSTVGTVADVGMKGIEIGDKVGVLALANVYRAERIALENAGVDPASASEQAAEKLMLIAENTAQGTTDMNTFDEQSRLGSLTSLFMQFKTAPLQQFGYEFAAFQDWKAAPTDAKRAMKLLSTILVNHVLANIVPTAIDALMTTMFGAIRGDDDKEKEKNRRHVVARALARSFLGPFGSVMFYGVIADNAVQFVANWMTEGKPVRKTFGSSGSLPADNAVEMISNAVEGGASTLFKAVEKGTIDDLWKTSIDVIAELATMTYPGRIYKKSQPKKKK